jgi:hypothetical protein
MKALILVLTALSLLSGRAQGTLEYRAILTGANAIPPNSNAGAIVSDLVLTDSRLSSRTEVSFGIAPENGTELKVYRSTAPAQLGTYLFSFAPGGIGLPDPVSGDPGGRVHNLSVALNTDQLNWLNSGQLFISLHTPEFPNGLLRGGIAVVPEPGILGLCFFGCWILLASKRNGLQ